MLRILCALSLLAVTLAADSGHFPAVDHKALLMSILPDLHFEYELRKARDCLVDAAVFYIGRFKSFMKVSKYFVPQFSDFCDYSRFKLLKKYTKVGEMTTTTTVIAVAQSLDDSRNMISFDTQDPYLLLAYFYDEGEVFKSPNVAIGIKAEDIVVDVRALAAERRRIAFLREAAKKSGHSKAISCSSSVQVPLPMVASSSSDVSTTSPVEDLIKLKDFRTTLKHYFSDLHRVFHPDVSKIAYRYESPSCASRVYDDLLQRRFRQVIPKAIVRSRFGISGYGQKKIKKILSNGTIFKKNTCIILFSDGSQYLAEHDGYIFEASIRSDSNKHPKIPTPLTFVLYHNLWKAT